MKKFLSTKYSDSAFNLSMLILRVASGLLILSYHGLDKLQNFATLENNFYSFMGMGSKATLILAIFSEVFCGLFVVLGLFTRLAVIPLILMLLVAVFSVKSGMPLMKAELDFLYLAPFFVLLLCGPGKISIDAMINR